ncbi:MAG: outer membrane beta-barrel protein [Alphaproteobacteria bacterium]|nr:outer membrane beta-barrel protein [Alphaproteobacteria bacterium]
MAVAAGIALLWASPARAQFINQYFPANVPGYEREPGVTVASRLRPAYDPLGVRLDGFTLQPQLTEGMGYTSNAAGLPHSPGSFFLNTAPSLTLNSDWSRDQLGAALTLDDRRYFDTPAQNYTDWTATIGGGYTIGRHDLTVGYSHLSLHEDPTQVGSAPSTIPIPYSVDDLRAKYTFEQGRFLFTPTFDVQRYQFGDSTRTVLGQVLKQTQSSQNRVVLTGGLQTNYMLSDQRSLIFVVKGIDSQFTEEPPRRPTNSSKSFLAFGGIDYQANGVWRYRLLLGVETRIFDAPQTPTHTAPIAEGSVIWTPTGLTSVTGVLSRTIEDPASSGTGAYTYTRAALIVDHEYLRNVLLQGRVGFEAAEYLNGGGTQTDFIAGARVKWLLNRNVQLSLDYSYRNQTGISGTIAVGATTLGHFSGSASRNVALLAIRLAL